MTEPDTISADYSLRPSELCQQPEGGPLQVVDVRALLLDPVDLRGIPWRDGADRTRWAPPAFLPPSDADGRWLINLEELPSALPMVQAALYQLVLDRKCGEYELPEGAALIACGNREGDRGVVHRMPAPLASRFVHLEIRVDACGLVRLGCDEWNRSGGTFLRVDAPRAAARLQPPIDGEGFPVSEDMGDGLEHRAPPERPRPGGRTRALPGHRRRGRGGRVLGLLASLARTAPSPHRHRRSRGRRGPRQRQRVDRALRIALQDGRRHQSRRHCHPTPQGFGARSASSSSAPASAASPRFSIPRLSSSGPPPKPADPTPGDPCHEPHL